jgi:hypothetical protein
MRTIKRSIDMNRQQCLLFVDPIVSCAIACNASKTSGISRFSIELIRSDQRQLEKWEEETNSTRVHINKCNRWISKERRHFILANHRRVLVDRCCSSIEYVFDVSFFSRRWKPRETNNAPSYWQVNIRRCRTTISIDLLFLLHSLVSSRRTFMHYCHRAKIHCKFKLLPLFFLLIRFPNSISLMCHSFIHFQHLHSLMFQVHRMSMYWLSRWLVELSVEQQTRLVEHE